MHESIVIFVLHTVCFNNTVNGDESSCFNLICDCKEGYKPPQSCCELECVQGFSNVNGTCERKYSLKDNYTRSHMKE